MWRPQEVVRKHRDRATALWLILIAAIIIYTTLLINTARIKSRNPSTSYALSNDVYDFPDVYVCFYDNFGCDRQDLEESCRDSVFETGRRPMATFNPISSGQQKEAELAPLEEKGYCVVFTLSQLILDPDERNPEDYVVIDMYWYPGGGPNASTTCGPRAGQWESHSESVTVFLRDPATGELSAGSQLPYSCITNASTEHTFDFMGIGLTKVVPLSGDNAFSYKPLVVFSYTKKEPSETWSGVTSPFAHLSMEVAQSVNSFEVITEIDPWELAEMFGNIGGFWDFILFLWPFFFVPIVRPKSSFKFRNFFEPCAKRAQEPETTTPASARREWTNRSSRGRTFDSSARSSVSASRDRSVDSLESGASSQASNSMRPSRRIPTMTNSPRSRR